MNESFWTARWQHIGSPLLMLIEEDRVPRGMRFFSYIEVCSLHKSFVKQNNSEVITLFHKMKNMKR